jgi:tetratricopeptide (TPR) repeat protein
MQVLEKTKREIENKSNTMSDFLRMEYLENCTKKFTDSEILRFCYFELSKLYEAKHMYTESLKYLARLKEVSFLEKEKINCMIKEIELLIKSGVYDRADACYKELLKHVSERERFEIKRKIIEFYKNEAQNFERSSRVSGTLKVYEKLVHYLVDNEKNEIRKKMLVLYKKLGKIRESIELERQLSNEDISFRKELI